MSGCLKLNCKEINKKLFNLRTANLLIVVAVVTCLAASSVAQQVYDIQPCTLCIYVRYLFCGIFIVGAVRVMAIHKSMLWWAQFLMILGAFFVSCYHVGVEKKWWAPPAVCYHENKQSSAPKKSISDLSEKERVAFLNEMFQEDKAPIVGCDKVKWRIIGVSVTILNALLLFLLGLYSLISFIKNHKHHRKTDKCPKTN